MPRLAAMVKTSVWADAEFVALSPTAKLVYLMLLSQPDVNHLGVLPLVPTRWARLVGCPVQAQLAELAEAGFVVLDVEVEQLLIRSFMRNDGQLVRMPNVLRAAMADVVMVPSELLRGVLLGELERLTEEETGPTAWVVLGELLSLLGGRANPKAKGSRKGSPKGSRNPTKKGSENPLGTRDQGLGTRDVGAEVAVPARAPARGTRIPLPFPVTTEMVAWVGANCPGLDGKYETQKFVDYWKARSGAAGTKLDWLATWRNWMRSAAERKPGSNGQTRRSTTDDRVSQALAVGEELARRMEETT